MDLPEAGPVHVVPVPALAHQFVDVLGAVFRQGKNDLKEEKCIRMNDEKKKKKRIHVKHVAIRLQKCYRAQFENIPLHCSHDSNKQE